MYSDSQLIIAFRVIKELEIVVISTHIAWSAYTF